MMLLPFESQCTSGSSGLRSSYQSTAMKSPLDGSGKSSVVNRARNSSASNVAVLPTVNGQFCVRKAIPDSSPASHTAKDFVFMRV